MANSATESEFFSDLEKPQDQDSRLMRHNLALRDNIQAVAAIKELLDFENYLEALEIWCLLSPDTQNDLWVAPTKGGIFTSVQRNQIRYGKL
jgi:hypothetical protein